MAKSVVMSVAAILIVGAGAAQAASPDFCQDYANAAAQQYHRMRATCGRPPSNLWHADRGLHYSWCLSAPTGAVRGQTRQRDRIIADCDPSYGD